MINSNMTHFQQRLAGIRPLLFLFLFLLLLLIGVWLLYKRTKKYRNKYGENKIFYIDEDFLIIDKLKSETFFGVFVPLLIKFPIRTINYVEIGYIRWRRIGYVTYIQIIKKNRRKSFRYYFSVNVYKKRKFFETPVNINEIYMIEETMRKIEKELDILGIPCKVNEKETKYLI